MDKPMVYLNKRDSRVYGLREPTPIQIVCGDCSESDDEAGNLELLPMRTFLAMDGRCYTCGGRSFVIASELCSVLRRTIAERRQFGFEAEYATAPTLDGDAPKRDLWVRPEGVDGVGTQPSRPRADKEILPNFGVLVN
jgi:hypothetical protein